MLEKISVSHADVDATHFLNRSMTVHLNFRIPYSAFPIRRLTPASHPGREHFTAPVGGVLGNIRVSRCSFHGYTDIGNTR